MASQTKYPNIATNDNSVGTVAWTDINNIKVDDGTVASASGCGSVFSSVRLVKGGNIAGTDLADAETLTSTLSEFGFGGSSEMWGLSWEASDINAIGFGAVVSFLGSSVSNYAKATDFNFTIPPSSVINGIEVIFTARAVALGSQAALDVVKISVYYTPPPTIQGVQSMTGVQSITF